MPGTIWSTTDRLNITLSGANLVATATNNSAGGVRTPVSLGSGKFYWEYTGTAFFNGFGTCIGVGNASAVLTTVVATPTNACIFSSNSGGLIYMNSATATGFALGTPASNAVIGLALDLTNLNIWFRIAPAGNWNGNATHNPATNAGGISIAAIFGSGSLPMFGLMAVPTGLQNAAITANFGDTAFTGAVPAGFTSGFPSTGSAAGGGAAQARVAILA